MEQIIDIIVGVNFVVSVLLVGQVLQHFLFFKQGTPSVLTDAIKRVFLADFLMGISVLSFNFIPFLTGQFHNTLWIEFGLKGLQTISIAYALYANFELYKVINARKD